MNKRELLRAAVIGHAVADALGVPVEFSSRAELERSPVKRMMGYGTYPYPEGCWSDDTSMAIAALDSLSLGEVDLDDVMCRFCEWYYNDAYTPTGKTFDAGNICAEAINNYFIRHAPISECGISGEYSNGNGALMRIYPFVLYSFFKGLSDKERDVLISDATALTHAHRRSVIGSLIYADILLALIECPCKRSVTEALRIGEKKYSDEPEAIYYERLLLGNIADLSKEDIKSGGYVVHTLEAAVWCLLKTDNYRDAVLLAVNLGEDTDTTAAITGSLAAVIYGYGDIPVEWIEALKGRDLLEEICVKAALELT